jgi:hypothetical protein
MVNRRRLEAREVLSRAPNGVSERRQTARDGINGEPRRSELVALILGTYTEMPGLALTLPQAARLFGLRESTCLVVLEDLVRDGRLRRSSDGQYRVIGEGF